MDTPSNRLRLVYTLEDGDTAREVELPFVIGVLANLSGSAGCHGPEVWERDFEEVQASDLDRTLNTRRPRIVVDVSDVLSGTGQWKIDLSFERMEEFDPASLARRISLLADGIGATTATAPVLARLVALVMQHERFRELEAAWRGLAYLVGHTTPRQGLKVFVLDITKHELFRTLQRFRGTLGIRARFARKFTRVA